MSRESIYKEIDQERAAQDRKWGGPAHDDGHDPSEWHRFIADHAEQAKDAESDTVYRRQMVRVAALAVAALESLDRHQAKQAPPKTVTLHGASDDLVEVGGAISEEFGVNSEDKLWLLFSEGSLVLASYGGDGKALWRFERLVAGAAAWHVEPAKDEIDDYTDRAELVGPIAWVAVTDDDPRGRDMQPVPDSLRCTRCFGGSCAGSDDKRELWTSIAWTDGSVWTSE